MSDQDVPGVRRVDNDGAVHPYAQDLGGVWHRRSSDDPWLVGHVTPNARGVCGQAVHSVHVSAFDPRTHHEFGEDGESLCDRCFAAAESDVTKRVLR